MRQDPPGYELRSPSEALDHAISKGYPLAFMLDRRRQGGYARRPGEIIEALPEATRALLRNLRSDDVVAERVPRWAAAIAEDAVEPLRDREYGSLSWKRWYRDVKLAFDREKLHI